MHVRSFCLLTFALPSLAALALPPAQPSPAPASHSASLNDKTRDYAAVARSRTSGAPAS